MLKRLRRDLKKAQTELESLKESNQNTDAIEEMKVREKRSMEEERDSSATLKLEKERKLPCVRYIRARSANFKWSVSTLSREYQLYHSIDSLIQSQENDSNIPTRTGTVTNLKQSLLCSTKISKSSSSSSSDDDQDMHKSNDHAETKTKRSRKQFSRDVVSGYIHHQQYIRAVQEFRRELDDAIVSKFQEDDDAMQVEDLDLMQLESATELEIAQFCATFKEHHFTLSWSRLVRDKLKSC